MIRNFIKSLGCIFFISFFISSILVACGSNSSEPPSIDADQDGVLDDVDQYPNDTDNDGLENGIDPDSDNDDCPDQIDKFPLDPGECFDTDNDGLGNNADTDDDGDGVLDTEDAFPLDPNEWADTDEDGVGDNAQLDNDNDGFADVVDLYPEDGTRAGDHDGDGIDSLIDTDDDNDCYLDAIENAEGSNPLVSNSVPADSDNDCFTDQQELFFGSDPYSADSDGDGLNDNIESQLKLDPNNEDTDGDGLGDLLEVGPGPDVAHPNDLDGDGIIDALDYYGIFEFRMLEADPQALHDRFGLTADNSGNVYIANFPENKIDIYSINGNLLNSFLSFSADDLVANKDGSFVLADTFNDRIVLADSLGNVVKIFEYQPDGTPGGFLSPKGVDLDQSGNIYVADTWNNRIQRYDALKDDWTASASSFLDPQDIAVSKSGLIAVADTGNFRVQILDQNFNVVRIINSGSLDITPFDFRPRSVAFSPNTENLYIVDDAISRVVVVDINGQFLRSFGDFLYPCGIYVDKDDKVFVTDRYRLQVF